MSAAAFEARYRADADPWRTLSDPAELAKAAHVLAICGDGPFAAALELGCGIGGLTAGLAPRCRSLLALDAAPTAVAAARARLGRWPHARVEVATLPDELPHGSFDLVVASEVLYYLDSRRARRRRRVAAGGARPRRPRRRRSLDRQRARPRAERCRRARRARRRQGARAAAPERGPAYLVQVFERVT